MTTDAVTAKIFGLTDVGCVRTNNEDNLIVSRVWDDNHLLLAAIDGIGGYEGGEVAAEIARDVITRVVTENRGADCLQILKTAVTMANNDIVEHKRIDTKRSNMGCVVTSAIIDLVGMRVYMVHVGDSRLYQFTASEGLKKLSHDHSLVGYREEIGQLTEEQAMHHPQRNIIERSLGDVVHQPDDPGFLDAGIFGIYEPTQYLFCSDGLTDLVYSSQIITVLSSEDSIDEKVKRLIELAKVAGGKDNITCVIADINMPASAGQTVRESSALPSPEIAPNMSMFDDYDDDDSDITQYRPMPDSRTASTASPQPSPQPRRRMTISRFRTLILTIAISFIIGGTVGYFIGYYTAKADSDKAVAAIRDSIENADTVISVMNDPLDSVADPNRVGERVADTVNMEMKVAAAHARAAGNDSTKTN